MELELSRLRPADGARQRADAGARARAAPRHRARRSRSTTRLGEIGADERKVKQVLLNLLSNAVKFTPEGGTDRRARAQRVDGAVEIAVSDTGIGIAPEDQARCSRSSARSAATTRARPRAPGSGSRSPSFVELHGGTIRVKSEPGRARRSPSRCRFPQVGEVQAAGEIEVVGVGEHRLLPGSPPRPAPRAAVAARFP